jgi:hypothetical protein
MTSKAAAAHTAPAATDGGGPPQASAPAMELAGNHDMGGHTKQVKESGVLRTARVKNGGKDGEVYGDSPGGATGPAREWECIDLIIGRDNMDCRHPQLARMAGGRLPHERHGEPR